MATPLPTLCEIISDQGDVYNQEQIPFIPYRHRSFSAKPNSPVQVERVPYREANTSTSFYNEPYLIGCRTPQSYAASSLRRPTTELSSYSAYPPAPSRAYTLPPGYCNEDASLHGKSDRTTVHVRHRKDRARTAPCTTMPANGSQSEKSSFSSNDFSSSARRRIRTAPPHLVSRLSKVNFPERVQSSKMPYTVVQINASRPGSAFVPEEVILPQMVLGQVPHHISPSSWNSQSMTSKLHSVCSERQNMVDALRVFGHYDLQTSVHIHPKLTPREFDSMKRNDWLDIPCALCERDREMISRDSSLEVEMGSYSVPPKPEIATRRTPCPRIQHIVLEELQAKQLKTYLPLRRGTAFSMQSHLSSRHDTRDEDKVRWIDALNRWVAENESENQMPYMTFVNSMSVESRGRGWVTEDLQLPCPNVPCERYVTHMNQHQDTASHINAHQQEVILRRRRVRMEKVAEMERNRQAKKEQEQIEASKSPSKVRFESPRTPIVKSPSSIDAQSERKNVSPERISSSVTPWSEPSQSLSVSDKQSPSRSPTPTTTAEELNRLSPADSDSAKSPSVKGASPVPDVVISSTPDFVEEETVTPERELTPEEKKGSTPKVIIEDSKSLDLNVTSTEPVDIQVRSKSASSPPAAPVSREKRKTHEKRERWKRPASDRSLIRIENVVPPVPKTVKKKSEEWIYGDDDFSIPLPPSVEDVKSGSSSLQPAPTPSLPEPVSQPPTPKPKRRVVLSNKIEVQVRKQESKRRWGAKQVDKSLAAERRREEMEEERKKRMQEINQKIHSKKKDDESDVDLSQAPSFEDYINPGVHFEDYGWLAKYCIFNKGTLEIYKKTFDAVDDRGVGWLSAEDTMIALRAVNRSLTDREEHYIARILEIAGYKVEVGSDFKLFAVIAALSQKIAALDDWMRNFIGQLDLKMLDMKMFMCRMLWECNVDPEINKIPIDQLCVELKAGGVTNENITEVREKLGHLRALDLLDFLAYIPLFIMIHESVVHNPFDDVQDK